MKTQRVLYMKTQRVLYWMVFTAILAGLCLTTGCPAANTTTPAAPANPPQVQVLQYAQLASAAGDTTAHVFANPTLQADLVGLAALVQQIMGVQ